MGVNGLGRRPDHERDDARKQAPAVPTGNNFATESAARDFKWPSVVISSSLISFCFPAARSANKARSDAFELTDRPVGRSLSLNNSSRGRRSC